MDRLAFQYYCVVFFDLLGQKEKILAIPDIPETEEEERAFEAAVKESLGPVLQIRKAFKQYFEVFLNREPDTTLVSRENREAFIVSQQTTLLHYSLSDSTVMAVPLTSSDNEADACAAMNGVYAVLTATSAMALLSLACGVACRGGIDVGVAVRIPDNEIYGPGLTRAIIMESCAGYPRFTVGISLLDYLQSIRRMECRTPLGLVAKGLANKCAQMITRDTDQKQMLDFLGLAVKDAFGGDLEREIVLRALRFVQETYDTHGSDKKLASRYRCLLDYFHSRASVWDLDLA